MMSGIGSVNLRIDTQGAHQSPFKMMDRDGDNKVTKDEMSAMFADRAAAGGPTPSVDDLFAEVDTNGDGAIDQGEDQAFRSAKDAERMAHAHQAQDIMRQIFAKLDTDGDGSIGLTELASAFGVSDQR